MRSDLAFSDHCLHPEEDCVDVFHSSEPSPAPNRNSSCGVHPRMGIELQSPVKVNALQAKQLRCRTHQPTILRFAGAECNHGLSSAVRADGAATQHQRTTRNTLRRSDTACTVRITPGFDSCNTLLHLNNQTRLGRAPRKRASLFSPISSRFDGRCILRARSRHSICPSGLSLEKYCARMVFARYRSDASFSIGTSPSMSVSLSLTPGVVTDGPVTPNYFLISSACRRSASQVMPSAVHSTILPSTGMLCTQSWYPGVEGFLDS